MRAKSQGEMNRRIDEAENVLLFALSALLFALCFPSRRAAADESPADRLSIRE